MFSAWFQLQSVLSSVYSNYCVCSNMFPVWFQLQSFVRMWRDRKRYRDRKKFFKDHVSSVSCRS